MTAAGSARRAPLLIAALGCAAALSGGCGKSIVPGTRYDQSLLDFETAVEPAGALQGFKAPTVGVLWTDPMQHQPDVVMPARYMSSAQLSSYPDPDLFQVHLFRPPPSNALFPLDGPNGSGGPAVIALGEVVLFEDENGDGTFAVTGTRADIAMPDTRFLAGASVVLTYVSKPMEAGSPPSPLGALTTTGYHLIELECQGDDSRLPAGAKEISGGFGMIVQPSPSFPEVRPCLRTHSP